MRKKNVSRSKIKKLPEPVRERADEIILAEGYQKAADFLQSAGHDISLSAVGRYGKTFVREFEETRAFRQYARLLAEDGTERPATELLEAANLLLAKTITQILIDPQMDAAEKIDAVGRTLSDLQKAQVSNEQLKLRARREYGPIKAAFDMLKREITEQIGDNHPDIAEKIIQIADQITAR